MTQPPLLNSDIQQTLLELSKIRKSKVLLLHTTDDIHSICEPVWLEVFESLCNLSKVERLDVVLESYGGQLDAAYKISKLFRKKATELTIIVPYMAKSAATLIALSADKIILAPNAELGPLDAQVAHPRDPHSTMSALDGFKTLEFLRSYALDTMNICVLYFRKKGLTSEEAIESAIKLVDKICNPLLCQIDPILMGAYDRILQIAIDYGIRLLKDRLPNEEAQKLLDKITKNYPSHSFVIDLAELDALCSLPHQESPPEITPLLSALYQNLLQVEEHLIMYVDAFGEEVPPSEPENGLTKETLAKAIGGEKK